MRGRWKRRWRVRRLPPRSEPCTRLPPPRGTAGGRELRTTFPIMHPGAGQGRAERLEPGLCRERPAKAVFLGPRPGEGQWERRGPALWPCLRPQGAVVPRTCALSPGPAGHQCPPGGPAEGSDWQSVRPKSPGGTGESDCQPTWPVAAERLESCHPWKEGLGDWGPLPSTLPFAVGGPGVPGSLSGLAPSWGIQKKRPGTHPFAGTAKSCRGQWPGRTRPPTHTNSAIKILSKIGRGDCWLSRSRPESVLGLGTLLSRVPWLC